MILSGAVQNTYITLLKISGFGQYCTEGFEP